MRRIRLGRRLLSAMAILAAAILAAASLASCGKDGDDADAVRYDPDPKTLSIVAGSEQRSVLDTVVKPWCEANGYRCVFSLKGSVDQARLLAAGNQDFDAYWFASTVFLQVGDRNNTLLDVKPMFVTPIVYAGWRGEMEKLGFVGRADVSISDILEAVESGRTTVWLTNPTQSNSGATVLFGFMDHFAGNGPGEALTMAQLDSPVVDQGITRFIRAMDQTLPSTGTLMDGCLARPRSCRTMFTYEDLVIEKNLELARSGRETLYTVYPRGSLAVSDAPLGFFPHGNGSDAPKRRILTDLQNHLLTSPEAGRALLALGRRPATGIGLVLDKPDLAVFNPSWGIQATIREQGIQYPAAAVVKAALDRYQTHYRRPVATFYCLDGSGSMGDNHGWEGVESAAHQIFDQDQAALNFLQTHPQDRTTVAIFNNGVTAGPWTVEGNDASRMHELTGHIVDYDPQGGTNMYACLSRAESVLAAPPPSGGKGGGPEGLGGGEIRRLVILMTDGMSDGDGGAAVEALAQAGIPVVAIAFGDETDADQLRAVADGTGGAYFQQNDLVAALRQAVGYK